MYVNTMSRHLGNIDVRPDLFSPACRPLWAHYKLAKGPNFPRIWEAFAAENPACRHGSEIRHGYRSGNPCGDARSGLLIDCWNRALQKGLSGIGGFARGSLGQSQAQLDVLSRWHQTVTHPKEIHPYPVTRHRRRSSTCQCGLGQDVLDEGSAWGSGGSDPISIPASPMPSLPADNIPLPTYSGPNYGPISPAAIALSPSGTYQPTPGFSPGSSTPSLVSPLSNLATSIAKIFTPSSGSKSYYSSSGGGGYSGGGGGGGGSSSLNLGGISPTLLVGGIGVLLLFMIVSRK